MDLTQTLTSKTFEHSFSQMFIMRKALLTRLNYLLYYKSALEAD